MPRGMAQDPDPAPPADGQNKKAPRTGDLILTREGVPLVVLGRPAMRDPSPDSRQQQILRGTLVVLMPSGLPGLHLPEVMGGRADFVNHWIWGWEPIGDEGGEAEREIEEHRRSLPPRRRGLR